MNYFRRYKSQTSRILFTGLLSVVVVIGLSLYVSIELLALGSLVAIMIALGLGLMWSITLTFVLSSVMVKPTRTIVQAIMHVSSEQSDQPAPDIKTMSYARPLLNHSLGTLYDVASGQRQEQAKLSREHEYMNALLSTAPMPIIVLDHQRQIRYHNSAAANYVGEKVEKAVGQEFSHVFNLAFSEDETLYKWLEDCQQHKVKETRTWERVKLTMPDHTNHIFDMMAAYSKNDTHGIETLLMLFDHTNLYMTDEAEVSFVSLAAHELRAPITLLRGYIEVFEDEIGQQLPEDMREFLSKMHVAAAQLSTFINNILGVAKVDSDQMNVHLKKENWRDIINNIAKDYSLSARVRGRKLTVNLPDSLPEVATDRVSIYEVLSNLIDNAIKYSHKDGEVIVTAKPIEGNLIETTVEDFGVGIPESIIDKLFEKFYRSHRSRENVGGSGLGLYLSKAIVEAHGGNIWVRSREGQGTTFGFTLPTFDSVADQLETSDNEGAIIRGAHGWIKNHSLYRR